MSLHLERATLLYEQSRYELAEKELRQELTVTPGNPVAHAMLGLCLAKQKKYKEATQEAQMAVHLGPDLAYAHYALGRVLDEQDRFKEAEVVVQEAIRLDPTDPASFALLSSLYLQQRRWADGLAAAEEGLKLDPQHVNCANLRAMALVKLGRRQEAGATVAAALTRDPENAVTHANQGWTLLERGEHRQALEHFREALHLDPELEWAREGIVEALKARHFIYRLILGYFFWMSRWNRRTRWALILGLYFAVRILRGVVRISPALAPFIWPVLILYFIFVYLSWTADTLFNLLLRLDPFGRLALSEEQVIASNWVGACLLAALAGLVGWLLTNNGTAMAAAIGSAVMVIPVSGTFKSKAGRGRKTLALYTVILAVVGLIGLGLSLVSSSAAVIPAGIFFFGLILFSFVANFIISRS